MLKKIHRLPARTRLQNAFYATTPFFTVRIATNDQPVSRFGFIVSKKIAKQAVKRNRAKRILRSCVEELLPSLRPEYDMLFTLRSADLEGKRSIVLQAVVDIFTTQKMLL